EGAVGGADRAVATGDLATEGLAAHTLAAAAVAVGVAGSVSFGAAATTPRPRAAVRVGGTQLPGRCRAHTNAADVTFFRTQAARWSVHDPIPANGCPTSAAIEEQVVQGNDHLVNLDVATIVRIAGRANGERAVPQENVDHAHDLVDCDLAVRVAISGARSA